MYLAVADEPETVGGVFAASLPATIAAGMLAIAAMLVSMQVQQARIESTVQSTAQAVQELKSDSRSQLTDLDRRVRVLEIRK